MRFVTAGAIDLAYRVCSGSLAGSPEVPSEFPSFEDILGGNLRWGEIGEREKKKKVCDLGLFY